MAKDTINLKRQNSEIGDEKTPILKKPPKRKKSWKFFIFFVIFLFTSLIVFSSQVIVSDQSSASWFSKLPIIKQIKFLAESADRSLKGESEDRINILLLGIGGRTHEGGLLTDTIILTSLEPSSKKAGMISIPRDLAVPIENMGSRKINHINAYAEVEKANSGGLAISQAVSDMLKMPIDYYLRIDFAGFKNIIDEIGGIDVEIENTINDYRYPIKGMEKAEDYESRFEHFYIEKGWHHLDGETALKYARSRHAIGVEGSDFARARRQQKIIEAVKDNLLSVKTLLKPKMISNILNELHDNISTNLKLWEILKLWDMFKDIEREKIINKVLDNSPNGLLVDMITEEGAYILTPRSGDFSEIQYFVNNIFSDAPVQIKNKVVDERATVEIRNGTWINGLASKMAVDIEKYGFIIVRIGNSSRQNFQKSVIYDLTYGEKERSLTILKNRTNANISFGLPEWLVDDISQELTQENNPVQPDFILIIGQNADKTDSGIENPEN
ncbi:LCP family protein [bacterium]|nr:LCP family protein [bacterium]